MIAHAAILLALRGHGAPLAVTATSGVCSAPVPRAQTPFPISLFPYSLCRTHEVFFVQFSIPPKKGFPADFSCPRTQHVRPGRQLGDSSTSPVAAAVEVFEAHHDDACRGCAPRCGRAAARAPQPHVHATNSIGREYTTTASGRTAASTWALSQCRVLVRHHYPHGAVPQ